MNIIFLNLLWFASVLGAANDMLWPAVCMLSLMLAVHFVYQGISKLDIKIISVSLICGILIDGFLMNQGLVVYANKIHNIDLVPPVWILILWIGFGMSVNNGMKWLLTKPVMGGFLMFLGAPLSYLSAVKLNAVTIPAIWQAWIFIGGSWLVYFLLISHLTQNRRGFKNALA